MKRFAALLMILCSSVTLSYAKTKPAPASLQLKDAEWSFEKVIEVPNTGKSDKLDPSLPVEAAPFVPDQTDPFCRFKLTPV